jgi:hypothetical protein
MVQSTMGRLLTDVEGAIESEFRKNPPTHEPRVAHVVPRSVNAPSLGIPDYVEHSDGATEIGKLSAEAVVRAYEAAAKEIEAMGAELIQCVRQCEAMTRDALAVTGELKKTADRYREEGKRVFVHIENCSLVTAEVRKTCTELLDKLAATPTNGGLKPKKR